MTKSFSILNFNWRVFWTIRNFNIISLIRYIFNLESISSLNRSYINILYIVPLSYIINLLYHMNSIIFILLSDFEIHNPIHWLNPYTNTLKHIVLINFPKNKHSSSSQLLILICIIVKHLHFILAFHSFLLRLLLKVDSWYFRLINQHGLLVLYLYLILKPLANLLICLWLNY